MSTPTPDVHQIRASWSAGRASEALEGSHLTAQHDEHGRRNQTERAPPQDIVESRILQISHKLLLIDQQENEHQDNGQQHPIKHLNCYQDLYHWDVWDQRQPRANDEQDREETKKDPC